MICCKRHPENAAIVNNSNQINDFCEEIEFVRIAPPYVEAETIATQFLASSSALDGVEEVDGESRNPPGSASREGRFIEWFGLPCDWGNTY